MEESRKATLLKGVIWRIVSTIQSSIVTFLFTGDLGQTLNLMILLNISGFIVYYFFERGWTKIK